MHFSLFGINFTRLHHLYIALLYRHLLKHIVLVISLKKSSGLLTGSDIAGAFALLHEAEAKLKRIVHDKFEAAIQNGDRNSVERCEYTCTCEYNFFKIFQFYNNFGMAWFQYVFGLKLLVLFAFFSL